MAMSDIIASIRKEADLTQEEMARRLYVTRQAVSRWENGETTPSIDMVKLISVTFNVPLERFFEMPMSYYCQCCSMPIPDPALHGTESDGSANDEFCKYCYQNGDFTAKGVSMDEFIEATADMEAKALGISREEAVSLMSTLLPHLKRWREAEENEAQYGEELRECFGDDVVDASKEKYVSMGEGAHAQANELELAIKEQLRRAMESGDVAGDDAHKLVEMHRQWLCMYWPDGMYEPAVHRSLADGYLADPRFIEYYDAVNDGATQFLRDAIYACTESL